MTNYRGTQLIFRAMRVLISSQIFGRYMNTPAWQRAITPQKAYFLNQGLHIDHKRLYQSFILFFCVAKAKEAAFEKDLIFDINIIISNDHNQEQQLNLGKRKDFNLKNNLIIHLQSYQQYNYHMYSFLILILLIVSTLSISQTCQYNVSQFIITSQTNYTNLNNACPNNSYCMSNNYCACEKGFIGQCTQAAYQMVSSSSFQVSITNSQYTFFSVSQEIGTYSILAFSLCYIGKVSNNHKIDVWEDKGGISQMNTTNAIPGGKNQKVFQGCKQLVTPLIYFQNQQNGLPQKFILGVMLINQGTAEIKISLQIENIAFWDLFQMFLIILGSVFLFILALAIVVLVYKWRRRRIVGGIDRYQSDKDISHFQNFMPKYKLSEAGQSQIGEESCSVCLADLSNNQWVRKTICNHVFHQDCLDQWCKTNLTCPICRRSFELKDIGQFVSTIQSLPNQPHMRNPLLEN